MEEKHPYDMSREEIRESFDNPSEFAQAAAEKEIENMKDRGIYYYGDEQELFELIRDSVKEDIWEE